MMHHEKHATHDELAWQAFRFIAGEMTRDEHDHFAERLAEDQAAREAVAAAVEVAQATAIALATQPVASRPLAPHHERRSRRWLWATLATAACIAAVWGALQLDLRSNSSGARQTAALAAQWSEVREQSPATTFDEEFDEDSLIMEDDEALDVAPEWMLAAVEQQDMDDMINDQGEIEGNIEESREQ
jgi:hypothetical protein